MWSTCAPACKIQPAAWSQPETPCSNCCARSLGRRVTASPTFGNGFRLQNSEKVRGRGCRATGSSGIDLDQRVADLMETLRKELPEQYEKDLDYSIYDPSIVFVDPVTLLEGRLLYRGMISTLRMVGLVAFEPSTLVFNLYSIEEIDPNSQTTSAFNPRPFRSSKKSAKALRTVWSTTGRTKWNKNVIISGDDIFRISKEGLIISHESAWNESPDDVTKSFNLF